MHSIIPGIRKLVLPLVAVLTFGLAGCTEAEAAGPGNDVEASEAAAVQFLRRPPRSYPKAQRQQFDRTGRKLRRALPGDDTDWSEADADAIEEAARVLTLFAERATDLAAPPGTAPRMSVAADEPAARGADLAAVYFLKHAPKYYSKAQRKRFHASGKKLSYSSPGDGTSWSDADADAFAEAARVLGLFDARAAELLGGSGPTASAEGAPASMIVRPAPTTPAAPEKVAEAPVDNEPDVVQAVVRPVAAPAEPAKVAEVAKPTTPVAPVKAVEPAGPVKPVKALEPTKAVEPSAPAKPAAAPEPVEVAEAPGPAAPAEPEQPAEPAEAPDTEVAAAEPEEPAQAAGEVPAAAPRLGAAAPGTGPSYGNSVASINDVANLTMKGERHALRFEVPAGGFTMDQVLVWWRYNDPGKSSTYSKGDGGTYDVSLQRIGGNGAPDGRSILSFTEIVDTWNRPNRILQNYQRSRDVPRTRLEPGQYALVFENLDPDPKNNYASLNGPIWWDFESVLDDPSQADPAHPNRAALKEFPGVGWDIASPYGYHKETLGAFYMPVWAVRDSVARVSIGQDIHYGEAVTSQTPIKGRTKVRQRITPTGNLNDAQLNLMVGRAAGDGPLIVRVNGREVASVSGLPRVPDPEAMHRRGEEHFRWISVAVPDGTVRAGREAIVELSSPDGHHRICAGLQNRYYGPKDWDGRAERSVNGGAWTGWRAHGKDDAKNVQLCAYFSGDD